MIKINKHFILEKMMINKFFNHSNSLKK